MGANSQPSSDLSKADSGASDALTPNSSSASHATRLTPELGSDDSDSDLEQAQYGPGIKLQQRGYEKRRISEPDEPEEDDYEENDRRRRASVSTTQSYQLYTPDEERAVIRKFDRRLVLFVALLYLLSFLDRSNIGNARIAGLDIDLNLDSSQYQWILTSFYISYIVFEWMSVLWKIIPAHIYVTAIVLSWGITASLQSCATSFAMLIVLRTMLGIGEAAFTGVPFYLSMFYKRSELALRTGFFISAAPLATSFASSLAWVIIKLGEKGPIAPWRMLFLVEGFPSILIAVVAWNVVPDGPGKAEYLTKRQAKIAILRLRRQKMDSSETVGSKGLKWREVLQTLIDPKSYLTAFMFFCTNMAFASMPVFLPSIIHQMGHSALASQALSAPPYLLSFVVVITTAWLSDRYRNRSYFVCFHALLSASGYAFMALAGPLKLGPWWRYGAIYPAAVGFFSVITIIITWTINNQASESKQGTGFAMLQLIGQCGPLVGTRLYPDEEGPLYLKGMSVCAGAMVLVACLSISLRFYLQRENRKNTRKFESSSDEAQESLVGKEDHPSRHFQFVYML